MWVQTSKHSIVIEGVAKHHYIFVAAMFLHTKGVLVTVEPSFGTTKWASLPIFWRNEYVSVRACHTCKKAKRQSKQ